MLPMTPSLDADRQEINVVPMNWRKEFKPIPGEPGEYKEIHSVDLVKKGGSGNSVPMTVNSIKKKPMLWEFVEPFYERWLKGQEDPVDGTPLDVLPFVHPDMIDHLRSLQIKTAEDLAAVNDSALDRIGMGARMMQSKARLYIENKKGDMKIVAALAERDAENASLRAEVDELKAMVNSLVDDKPKRRKAAPK